MDVQDKILQFLRAAGPTLPNRVAKNVKLDTLITSAHLSHLRSRGKIKISHLKVGGSPLYYLEGQEENLFEFTKDNLNPKDYAVLSRLKEDKVLRENELEVLAKVALRKLKDFAVPLHVTVEGKKELFWKWHLLAEENTNTTIAQMLRPVQEEQAPVAQEPVQEVQIEANESSAVISSAQTPVVEPSGPAVTIQEPSTKVEAQEVKVAKETPIKEAKVVKEPQKKKPSVEKQKKLAPKPAEKKVKVAKKKSASDSFFPSIESYFKSLKIVIEQKETVRKNSELNFLVSIPNAVGSVTYFCKAKKKARCDEKDISSAYMEAQVKKLPLLFLYTNSITKKAKEMLETDAFVNASIVKME